MPLLPWPLSGLGLAVLHHLLGERLSALAQLVEGIVLLLGGAVEIFLAERFLGLAHGFAGVPELIRRVRAFDAEAVDQALQCFLQLALALAEIVELTGLLALLLLALLLTVAAA